MGWRGAGGEAGTEGCDHHGSYVSGWREHVGMQLVRVEAGRPVEASLRNPR